MSLDYDPDRIIECETGAEALQWEAAERIYAGTLVKTQRDQHGPSLSHGHPGFQ